MSAKQYLRRSRGASRVCPIPAPSPIYSHVRCARVARYKHTRQAALGAGIGLFFSSPSALFVLTQHPPPIGTQHSSTHCYPSSTCSPFPCMPARHPPVPVLSVSLSNPFFGQCIDPMTLFPHHVDQSLALRKVSRVIPPPRPPHLLSHCASRPRSLTGP